MLKQYCGDVTIWTYPPPPMSPLVTIFGYPLPPSPGDVLLERPQLVNVNYIAQRRKQRSTNYEGYPQLLSLSALTGTNT